VCQRHIRGHDKTIRNLSILWPRVPRPNWTFKITQMRRNCWGKRKGDAFSQKMSATDTLTPRKIHADEKKIIFERRLYIEEYGHLKRHTQKIYLSIYIYSYEVNEDCKHFFWKKRKIFFYHYYYFKHNSRWEKDGVKSTAQGNLETLTQKWGKNYI